MKGSHKKWDSHGKFRRELKNRNLDFQDIYQEQIYRKALKKYRGKRLCMNSLPKDNVNT